ncbi:MAG: LysR family transcriptional regulator [Planctomycetales bacterium]|nr:LysR family transcriptional regulator [Planctomycetales bacterium]
MHLKSLKVFCDIVHWRSFSRAADENGISQSGASQIVHQIEEELSAQLIDRSKRPLVLTRAGQIFYEGCRRLVTQFERLAEEVRTMHHEALGTVTVASIYSVGLTHMNQAVQQFMRRHPTSKVRLRYEHPDRVLEMVESEVCDFGLVSFPKSTRSLEALMWRSEPMMLVCSPQSRFAAMGSVEIHELSGAKLVGFDMELKIRRETDRVLHGVAAETVIEFDNIETIKRAVEIDVGVSLLPAPTVAREIQMGTLVAVPLADVEFTRPVGIVYRRGRELGRTAQRFMDLLLETDAAPLKHEAAAPIGAGESGLAKSSSSETADAAQ